MPPEKRKLFLLHSRRKAFRYKLDRARQWVSDFLSQVEHPYIALSGGKDSTCVLWLVREQSPDVPAVYFDADCSFPEQRQHLLNTPNTILYPTDEPFLNTLTRFNLGAKDAPVLNRATMQSTVWGPIKRLLTEYQFDGFCYGLRKEEVKGRRIHGFVKGPVFYMKRDGIVGCQPVTDWKYDDVWAFIVSQNIPYCPVYDRMWHMPPREQRISYWGGETNRERGRWSWLKQNYPELFNKLAAKIPAARQFV